MHTIELDEGTFRALDALTKRAGCDTIRDYLASLEAVKGYVEEEETRHSSEKACAALKTVSGLTMKMPEKIAHVLYHLLQATPTRFSLEMEGFHKEHGQMVYISQHPGKMAGWDSAKVYQLGKTGWYFNAALSERDTKEFFDRICRKLKLSPTVRVEIHRIISEKPPPLDISKFFDI